MKYLLFLLLISCSKDFMEVTPRHQIILLNDDYTPPDCDNSDGVCLPISDLDDVAFQLITDFDNNVVDAILNHLVALPCDGCGDFSAQDVFDLFWGNYKAFTITSDNGGFLKIEFNRTGWHNTAVGDKLFIQLASGGGYGGLYTITEIDLATPGVIGLTIDAAFTIAATGDGYLLTTSMFISQAQAGAIGSGSAYGAGETIQIDDDAEFPGSNYLWEIRDAHLTDLSQYEDNECLRLCVYQIIVDLDASPITFEGGECLGNTNCFKKVNDLCYTTKILYQFNEESMGFYGTPYLAARLPMYFRHPQYPKEESGYQKSNGTFLKLSSRINKQYILETDHLPDALHQRIAIALEADLIQVWNTNENLAMEGIYMDESYEIEWNEDVKDNMFAKATAIVKKRTLVGSVNSNCV